MSIFKKKSPLDLKLAYLQPGDPAGDSKNFVRGGKLWAVEGDEEPYPLRIRAANNLSWKKLGGPGEFGPLTVANLYAYFNAFKLADQIPGLTNGAHIGATWPDLTVNAHNATQATLTKQPKWYAAHPDDGKPYTLIGAPGDGSDSELTVPCPAGAKVIHLVLRETWGDYGYVLHFDPNYTDHRAEVIVNNTPQTYYARQTSGGGGGNTAQAGFSPQWNVVTLVIHSATSTSLYVNGELVETFTPYNNLAFNATQFYVGKYAGYVRQIAVISGDYTTPQVQTDVAQLMAMNRMNWKFDYVFGTSSTSGLLMLKKGVTGPLPLVFLNHTANADGGQGEWLNMWRPLTLALLDAGYLVGISDTAGIGWGNTGTATALQLLYDHAVANAAGWHEVDTSRVGTLGASMGGETNMTALMATTIPIKATYSLWGVMDMDYTWQHGFNGGINGAYGLGGGASYAEYQAASAGHNPMTASNSHFAGKYHRFAGGTGDTVIDWTNNSLAFITKVSGVAAEASVFPLSGGHNSHVADAATITDVLDFFDRSLT